MEKLIGILGMMEKCSNLPLDKCMTMSYTPYMAKKKTIYKPKPIKPFKTLDEEADFWDTHHTSPLFDNPKTPLSELPLIEPEKEATMSIRIQVSIKEKIEKVARSKGINPTTLARMWLIERASIEKTPSK